MFDELKSRQYETVGYVIRSSLELDLDGETVKLQSGDSWLVPEGATYRSRMLENLVAVEATSPPARYNSGEPIFHGTNK